MTRKELIRKIHELTRNKWQENSLRVNHVRQLEILLMRQSNMPSSRAKPANQYFKRNPTSRLEHTKHYSAKLKLPQHFETHERYYQCGYTCTNKSTCTFSILIKEKETE